MKLPVKSVISSIVLLFISVLIISGQQYQENYGNVPKTYVAYDKYQKAYKYHFLEPIGFYGPVGLTAHGFRPNTVSG